MKNILNRRIPTVLAVLFLFLGIGVTTVLVQTGHIFQTNASSDEAPHGIRVTNVTDTSFTVSYTTSASVLGSISYGTNTGLGQIALDDRDQAISSPAPHQIHYITISHLSPSTTYYFSVISGKSTFLQGTVPFQVTTGKSLTGSTPSLPQFSGTVVLPDGARPDEVIVYLNGTNSQPVSTLVRPDGSYVMSLTALRTADLLSYVPPQKIDPLSLLLVGPSGNSQVSLLSTLQSPLPPIILGKTYDFTTTVNPIGETASDSGSLSAFPLFTSDTGVKEAPKIITPSDEEAFKDQQPQFKGTALPNQPVTITIHSTEAVTITVKANSSGQWTFRPTTPLSPGQHTIAITTKTSSGILETIERTFTVYAQGSQFIEPSVSPTKILTPTPTKVLLPTATTKPTIAPTKAPTPTPTRLPTPTPTTRPSPTPTKKLVALAVATATPTLTPKPTFTPTPTIRPTLTATATPTITKLAAVSTTPTTLPPTGTSSLVLGVILSSIAVGVGSFLIFLARSATPL